MNVLSLFDGIGCLQVALNRAGIPYTNYYASEINEHAIAVTQYHYPNTIQLGDVREVDFYALPEMDLIAAGSPCQDISILNKERKGLDGEKSSLFYYFLKAKQKWPNAKFLLENVRGGKIELEITKLMGVRPIKLNSSWIVPQSRPRLYWTNIPVTTLPQPNRVTLQDILVEKAPEDYFQNESWLNWWEKNKEKQLSKVFSTLDAPMATCLTRRMYSSWNGNFVTTNGRIRRLTPIECERLQTLPEKYTSVISDKHAYEAIGNCWTVDIVAHILKHMR